MQQKINTLLLCAIFVYSICSARTGYDSLNALATSKFNSGDYAAALNLNIGMLKTARQEKNCMHESVALRQVGKMLYYLKDFHQAMAYTVKAHEVAADCGNDSIVQKTLHFIGTLYQERGMPDSSLYYYNEAKKHLEGTNNWVDLSTLYGVMGELYLRKLNNDSRAKECFTLCEKYALLSGNKSTLAFAYIKYSIYASLHRDCRQGAVWAQKARDLYREANEVEGEIYAINVLLFAKTFCLDTTIYKLQGQHTRMRDSIFQAKTTDRIAHYKTLYETEKTNAENKELLADRRAKNILIANIIGIGVLIILLLLLAYNRYRVKKEKELEKEKQLHKSLQYKAVIEAEENERSRVARELHDGIGQILSTAKMIVSIVKPADTEDEATLEKSMKLIDMAVKEVRVISHNLMPSSLTERGLPAALRELVADVNASGTFDFKLEMNAADSISHGASAVALYRIIQEIVHNTIKHAGATQIRLSIESKGNYHYISFTDNGRGFDTSTINTSKGIGWKNIFFRIELLGGTIAVNSDIGKSTSVNITFTT